MDPDFVNVYYLVKIKVVSYDEKNQTYAVLTFLNLQILNLLLCQVTFRYWNKRTKNCRYNSVISSH